MSAPSPRFTYQRTGDWKPFEGANHYWMRRRRKGERKWTERVDYWALEVSIAWYNFMHIGPISIDPLTPDPFERQFGFVDEAGKEIPFPLE